MAVKTLSKSKYGSNYKISPNFTLSEMACNDGSDKVLYSTELMSKLEELRAYGGYSIHINSGYRTPAYNRKIGGSSASNHTKGLAADIKVYKDGKVVPAKYICCICQNLGLKGIAMIKGGTSTHVDMRTSGSYRGDETYGYSNNVGGDFYKYFGIKKSTIDSMKYIKPVGVYEVEDKDMTYYRTLNDVPSWYKEAIKLLLDKGYLKGEANGVLNISEDFCRIATVNQRAGLYK